MIIECALFVFGDFEHEVVTDGGLSRDLDAQTEHVLGDGCSRALVDAVAPVQQDQPV